MLTIITAYCPCKSKIDPTTNTIITQQYHKYRKRGIHLHPRKQFLKDITKFILKLQLKNHEIILGIDTNLDTPLDPTFTEFIYKCNLTDLFHKKFNYHAATHQKRNCLDLILGSELIWQHLLQTGIVDTTKGAISDHSICYIDLHLDIFSRNIDPTSPTLRSVTSKQTKKFLKYGRAIDTKIQESKEIQSLLKQLDQNPKQVPIQKTVDSIDNIITQFIQKENNRFSRAPSHIAWSPIYKEKVLQCHQARKYYCLYKYQKKLLLPILSHIKTDRRLILKFLLDQKLSSEKVLCEVKKNATLHRFKFL